ncbi:SMI1/KNR4 family protein [Streptomyces sp. AV19]|uniref:SMI1/KNR4 family protein n=1 Tax=Streptomyces sp. AV19 TaxID=2793068 RepID=UPI0018FE432C|nr:SMI1/KNR4 family protein [Streptomyces sp. AV19]MBH1933765.1 SMI1/KNR4 family protein [Streptomyces sp. AV19]MDG4535731.1 SMI1/KNR4 family protein [Streptomyces sp. AV19]
MHPAVRQLTALVPPPQPPAPRDWADIEKRLGSRLPDDYKELVDVYGGGILDEEIRLLEPDCADPDYDLIGMARERAEILGDLWAGGEPKPPELLTCPDGAVDVLPFAYMEGSGAYLYWIARPGIDPDDWTVIFNEGRGPLWEHDDASAAEFLLGILTGGITSFYFSGFPAEQHRFEPNAEIWSRRAD